MHSVLMESSIQVYATERFLTGKNEKQLPVEIDSNVPSGSSYPYTRHRLFENSPYTVIEGIFVDDFYARILYEERANRRLNFIVALPGIVYFVSPRGAKLLTLGFVVYICSLVFTSSSKAPFCFATDHLGL